MSRRLGAADRVFLLSFAGVAVAITWIAFGGGRAIVTALTRADPILVAAMLAVTGLWLTIRFVRWQYMMRHAGVRIPIRGSLAAYLAGLPGTATPGYVGEIIRGVFIRRRYGVPLRITTSVLIAERLLDLVALALIFSLAVSGRSYRAEAVVVLAIVVLVFAAFRSAHALAAVLVLSIALWTVAGLLVFLASAAVGDGVPLLVSLRVFTAATLGGALSLMPAGVGSAGSILILQLRDYGQPLTDAIATTSLVRVASVGAALSLGFVFLMRELRWNRAARQLVTPGHFDDIADDYGAQFSEHVWQHLLRDKLAMIESALPNNPAQTGLMLDLGCGLGRQSTEMIRRGYKVTGIDYSPSLLRQADAAGVPVAAADALRLPFEAETFDLVYTIGVLHHLKDAETQASACREVARVLKPGGRFLIHESNPRNPLFRFYMGYMFPLLKKIDEGTELWIHPRAWTQVKGFTLVDLRYFTFLPDFVPRGLMGPLLALERRLEASSLRSYSVHYFAVLEKDNRTASQRSLSFESVKHIPGRTAAGEALPR